MGEPDRSLHRTTIYSYDRAGRLLDRRELIDEGNREPWARLADGEGPPPPRCEHDPDGQVFRITDADGATEVFRDRPTRFLCVEPDPETGAMRPVMEAGRPVYLHLCREEREPRRLGGKVNEARSGSGSPGELLLRDRHGPGREDRCGSVAMGAGLREGEIPRWYRTAE